MNRQLSEQNPLQKKVAGENNSLYFELFKALTVPIFSCKLQLAIIW